MLLSSPMYGTRMCDFQPTTAASEARWENEFRERASRASRNDKELKSACDDMIINTMMGGKSVGRLKPTVFTGRPVRANMVDGVVFGRAPEQTACDDFVLNRIVGKLGAGKRENHRVAPPDPFMLCLDRAFGKDIAATSTRQDVGVDIMRASQWAFLGGPEPWNVTGLASESIENLQRNQIAVESLECTTGGMLTALRHASVHWGTGKEMLILQRFVQQGGVAVVAVNYAQLRRWRATGACPSHASRQVQTKCKVSVSSATVQKKVEVRVTSYAMLKHLVSVLSEELMLVSDVVFTGGQVLKRGWTCVRDQNGPWQNYDVLRMTLPAKLVFDTAPGFPVIRLPAPGESRAMLAASLAEARAVCAHVWPPVRNSRVRRKLIDDDELVSTDMAGELGTVVGADLADEGGQLVERESWVLVRWDDGGLHPAFVGSLRPADNTDDFVERVQRLHHVGDEKSKAVCADAEDVSHYDESSDAHFIVVVGANDSCGSLEVWDPDHPSKLRMSMPVNVLQRCAEAAALYAPESDSAKHSTSITKRTPAALFVCRAECQPKTPPSLSWLHVGSDVFADHAALVDAGAKRYVDPCRRYKQAGRVLGRVVHLTGQSDVGLTLEGCERIFWLHTSRLFPVSAEGWKA